MNYQPRPPGRPSRPLERFRKRQRRQLAAAVGAAAVVAIVVICIAGLVWLVRACGRSAGDGSFPPAAPSGRDLDLARERATYDLRPAPWFCELNGSCFYAATDKQRREISPTSFPLDSLAGFDLDTREQLWEQPVDAEFSDFYLGGDNLVGFRQYRVDPPHILLNSYSAADGSLDWNTTIEGAAGGRITADGKVVILGYRKEDGFRLAAYNLEQRAKAWGMHVPLDGLITQDLSVDIAPHLAVRGWPGVVAYQLFNVIGLVDSGDGKRLREYAAPGLIYDFTLDSEDGSCYLLLGGNQADTYVIQSLAFEGTGSDSLYRFAAGQGDVLLLAQSGVLAMCYSLPPVAGEAPQVKAVCLHLESGNIVQEAEIPGVIGSVVQLPGDTGDLLLAVNQRREENGFPAGWGRLWRIPRSGGEVREAGRFRHAVLGLAPFKDDCLVFLRGGDIYSYISASNARRRIRRTRYEMLDWLRSQDEETLAVLSTPPAYLAGQPNQPMQVIIYH